MKQVFDALEMRFNGDAALKKLCRKLFLGIQGKATPGPVPFLDVTFGDAVSMDTFTADIREYSLSWTFHAASPTPGIAEDFSFHFRRVFDSANVISPWFTTVLCENAAVGGPELDNGVYMISATGKISVQYNSRTPVTKYS